MKVVAIIQARMGSTRLVNKMMLCLHGYPIIHWVYQRVVSAKKIEKVVVALPDTEMDDLLCEYLVSIGADVFRGSETDLVERYYHAAIKYGAEEIVRVCADRPLISPTELDRLIDFYFQENCDYAYNHVPINSLNPVGLGGEICSHRVLSEIYERSFSSEHREHLFNYLLDNADDYNIKVLNPPEELAYPQLKLDVDTYEDYRNLIIKPYRIDMGADEIIKIALG